MKRMLTICLIVLLLCSGCGKAQTETPQPAEVVRAEKVYNVSEDVDEAVFQQLLAQTVCLNTEALEGFRERTSSIAVDYIYAEDWFIQEYLDLLESTEIPVDSYQNKNTILRQGTVDYDALYTTVLENTQIFLEENKGIAAKYEGTTEELIAQVCGILADYLNAILPKVKDADLARLETQLEQLKVVQEITFGYAYFNSTKDLLGVMKASIDKMSELQDDPLVWDKMIQHECNHMLQSSTMGEDACGVYQYRFGPSYRFENLTVNCGDWHWYMEAAAERAVCLYHQTDTSLTYSTCISMQKILESARLFELDADPNEFLELAFQPDPQKIFDYFHCESEADRKEIVSMMYALNLWLSSSTTDSAADFFKYYEATRGMPMDYYTQLDAGCCWTASTAQTLCKLFYRSLTERVQGREVSVEDLFASMYFLEHQLVRLTKCKDDYRTDYNQDFYRTYISIQDDFLSILAEQLSVDTDTLHSGFSKYCNTIDPGTLQISFLDQEINEIIRTEAVSGASNEHSIRWMARRWPDAA